MILVKTFEFHQDLIGNFIKVILLQRISWICPGKKRFFSNLGNEKYLKIAGML